jgi:hypothetical protein
MSPRLAPGSYSGAACLLWSGARLVFEIQKPTKWVCQEGHPPDIGLGCIGGTMETGETPLETLQREAVEEIGCSIDIVSARLCADMTDDTVALRTDVAIDGHVPAMLWTVTHPAYDPGTKVAVFLGHCLGQPQPDDLPAIALAGPELITALDTTAISVATAKENGVEFREKILLPTAGRLVLANTLQRLAGLRAAHRALFSEILTAS